MELLPAELRQNIPQLNSTRNNPDPIVWVRFVARWAFCRWYVTEMVDLGSNVLFYGWVDRINVPGFDHFFLGRLERARGPEGMKVERDLRFEPGPLSAFSAEMIWSTE